MAKLSGKRVLVTGASGLVAFPVARELAKDNDVFAVARYSDPAQKRMIEAAGARAITFDLADDDLSALLKEVDVVINYAVLSPSNPRHYNVNAGATGRLARRYRECQAFVHGSTGSLYQYQGERPLTEADAYELHSSAEPYAASKIAAEFLIRHLSIDYDLLVSIVRIFSFYGPRGGIAEVGGKIINVGGIEAVTTQEYCEIAGEFLGKEPVFCREQPRLADLGRYDRDAALARTQQGLGARRDQTGDRGVARSAAGNSPRYRRTCKAKRLMR